MAPRTNLVIVPAGDDSLHTRWCSPDRDFDLCVNYYGDDAEVGRSYAESADYFFALKGTAFQIRTQILSENAFWRRYDYVQMIDDDVLASIDALNSAFETCAAFDLALAHPAFAPENVWNRVTRQHPSCILRYVNYIDLIAQIWRTADLETTLLPVLLDNRDIIKSGWGTEWVCGKLLGEQRMGVLDTVRLVHTRPPTGSTAQSGFYRAMGIDPLVELFQLTQRYGFPDPRDADDFGEAQRAQINRHLATSPVTWMRDSRG